MSVYEQSSNIIHSRPARRRTRAAIARLVRHWQRARTIAALERLDSAQLEDIGIARNDIARVVDDHFRRNKEMLNA